MSEDQIDSVRRESAPYVVQRSFKDAPEQLVLRIHGLWQELGLSDAELAERLGMNRHLLSAACRVARNREGRVRRAKRKVGRPRKELLKPVTITESPKPRQPLVVVITTATGARIEVPLC